MIGTTTITTIDIMENTGIAAYHADNSPLDRIASPYGLNIYHRGPPLELGALPAVFYFALSATESLSLLPYSQLPQELSLLGVRVFSFDLPAHGAFDDKQKAMRVWADKMSSQDFQNFFKAAKENIDFLIEKGLILPKKIATAGLSRGGFIATHIAASHESIPFILGFSPLTSFDALQEFAYVDKSALAPWNLTALKEKLSLKSLYFYIGNRDTRVSTKACLDFIYETTEYAYNQGTRSPQLELTLFPSIGHKGHGTPPHIFHQGAMWLHQKLMMP